MRLLAQDTEDLAVIAATLQDAILHVGEMTYLSKKRRFAMVLNRFMWEQEGPKKLLRKQVYKRTRAGLHFDGVLGVSSQNIQMDRKEGVLDLLTIKFEADGEESNGVIQLLFAGGGSIKLEVECIEASCQDMGDAWATQNKPEHGE
jgi:hypothetical protein